MLPTEVGVTFNVEVKVYSIFDSMVIRNIYADSMYTKCIQLMLILQSADRTILSRNVLKNHRYHICLYYKTLIIFYAINGHTTIGTLHHSSHYGHAHSQAK